MNGFGFKANTTLLKASTKCSSVIDSLVCFLIRIQVLKMLMVEENNFLNHPNPRKKYIIKKKLLSLSQVIGDKILI